MCCSPYTSCTNCVWTVFKTEGIGAFYRSYTTALVMNIPFQVRTSSVLVKQAAYRTVEFEHKIYSINVSRKILLELTMLQNFFKKSSAGGGGGEPMLSGTGRRQ